MKACITLLLKKGFKQMPWDKCPQGFKESDYRCFSHKEKNQWCEIYLSDTLPFGWIVGDGIKANRGMFFDTTKGLKQILHL